ncbi:MAG: hypothetical protein IJE70_07875 [Oscillospiraceae bacterium]|nr:hypothetical protein [Oscillospiraceae bacterium]
MKRFISLILAIIMVAAMVPGMALAAVEPAPIEYNITLDALTDVARTTYATSVAYNKLSYVSWLTKNNSGVEGALLDPDKTEAYELHSRESGSVMSGIELKDYGLNPTLIVATNMEEKISSVDKITAYNNFNFYIKIKVPTSGTYAISLANNAAIGKFSDIYKNSAKNELTKAAITDVYLSKVKEEHLASSSAAGIGNYKSELNAIVADSSKYLGRYDSRILGEEQKFATNGQYLEAGEYFLVFNVNETTTKLHTDYYYRSYDADATNPAKTYIYLQFNLSDITLTPILPARTHEYVIAREALTDGNNTKDHGDSDYWKVSWIPKDTNTAALLDLNKTDAYELSARIGSMRDNSSRLGVNAYYSQFLVNNWVVTAVEKYATDADAWAAARETKSTYPNYTNGNIQYGIRLKVERPGTYTLSLKSLPLSDIRDNYSKLFSTTSEFTAGAVTKVYFAKAAADTTSKQNSRTQENAALNNSEYSSKYIGLYDSRIEETQEYGDTEITIPEAGEYYVIFKADEDCSDASKGGNSRMYEKLSLSQTTENDVTTYKYTAQEFQLFVLSNITLTPVEEAPAESEEETAMKEAPAEEVEEDLSETADVKVVGINAEDAADTGLSGAVQNISANRGETAEVTAKEVPGYEFLYWGKGLGTEHSIVSTDPTYTVKATSGGTWLYAYYKKTDSTAVSVLFLDSNGDEITKSMVASDSALAAPSAPSAPGAPQFLGWKMPGDEKTYSAEEVAELTATGDKMVFVAQFAPAEEKADITVTENGTPHAKNYYYGEPVSVTAEATSGTKNFAYWKKGDEVVSFDRNYTFRAWESCSLTAVYLDTVPDAGTLRKIIIKGNVAEFIGLDTGVAEKGIIFRDTDATAVTLGNATHKIAMTTTGNHLSFNNDLTGNGATNFMGYAILTNGNVIYDK